MVAPSHHEIINWWPSAAEFARSIGTSVDNGRMIRLRGLIPPRYFHATVAAAEAAGFPALSYAALVAGLPPERRSKVDDGGRRTVQHF